MRCPLCEVDLLIAERHGVEIDYCPRCRGIWLDRGELDKILERAAVEMPRPDEHPRAAPQPAHWPQPAPPQAAPWPGGHPHGHEAHYHKKRKKSFLDDLFDFG